MNPISSSPKRIPLWLKIAYSLFMAVLVPVYWANYGPTNFLYFCDVALLLTLAGIWTESALLISMCCVGILLPQVLWCLDFAVVLCGGHLTGLTEYMVRDTSLFLRGLSLFHGWLPFLLFYLVRKTGYAPRAFNYWTVLAWTLCLICFTLLPAPAVAAAGDLTPRNVNYVFGISETSRQTLMPDGLYLLTWMTALAAVVYWPTHYLLLRLVRPANET